MDVVVGAVVLLLLLCIATALVLDVDPVAAAAGFVSRINPSLLQTLTGARGHKTGRTLPRRGDM